MAQQKRIYRFVVFSADETNTQAYIRHRYAVSVNDHMKIDKKSFDSDRSPEFH